MMAYEKTYKMFIQAIDAIFSYLIQAGFKKQEVSLLDTKTYAQAIFIGQNVGLSFSYDFIEEVCDCEIAKVENGEYVKLKGSKYLWLPLFSFLVERYNYRGGINLDESIKKHQFAELYKFNEMLKTVGRSLIEDKKEAFE